jgi:hypothetical protein
MAVLVCTVCALAAPEANFNKAAPCAMQTNYTLHQSHTLGIASSSSLLSSNSASTVLAVLGPTPLRLEKLLLASRALHPRPAPTLSSNTAALLAAPPGCCCCCCWTSSEARCSWEHSCAALLRCCWRLVGSAAPAHTAIAHTAISKTWSCHRHTSCAHYRRPHCINWRHRVPGTQ